MILELNPHQIVFTDFFEDWNYQKNHVLNEIPPHELIGGWENVNILAKAFYLELLEEKLTHEIYKVLKYNINF